MQKKLPDDLTERLLSQIKSVPEGLGIDALRKSVDEKISRRTLQRRLSALIKAGKLAVVGKGRASRYQHPAANAETLAEDAYIPLSSTGAETRKAVRKQIVLRKPVGYNREFLTEYKVNQSHYLTEEIVAQLHRLGRTPDKERPAGTYARHILNRLLIDLSWASSRLEGNTYSLLDTKRLIESGEVAEGKQAFETQMILNHKAAIEYLVESADEAAFNQHTLRNLHALLSDNLLPDSGASGRLRRIGVGIYGSVYHPLETPQLIEECFAQFVETAAAIHDPFEQAFFAMVHLPYLQPFEDVNKRVSRLAANIPLIHHNLCPLSFIDVPDRAYIEGLLGVYELNRIELLRDVFVWAYERSCQLYSAVRQSLGEPDPFKLRFRNELIDVIAEIVRRKVPATAEEVTRITSDTVPLEQLDYFVRTVLSELENLNEGNYARFKLRPSEYQSWLESRRG
jgi:hypothetical protein